MDKKKITTIMTVLTVVLLGLCAILYLNEDRTGPEIQFSNVTVSYHETGDKKELMSGVAAVDGRDGDVSNTLKIDRITEVQEGKYSVVTYIAKDESNNISKKDRWVNLLDGSTSDVPMLDAESTVMVETEAVTETETETDAPATEAVNRSGNLAGIVTATVDADIESETESESEAETEVSENTETPVIRLTTNEVELAIGDSFDCMSYIAGCMDDVDTIDDLYRSIIVNGSDKNGNEVGAGTISTYSANEYYLNYYVVDSDGNRSNVEKLTVTVK